MFRSTWTAVVTAVCTSPLVALLNVMTVNLSRSEVMFAGNPAGCDEWLAPPMFTVCVEGQMWEKVLGIGAKN